MGARALCVLLGWRGFLMVGEAKRTADAEAGVPSLCGFMLACPAARPALQRPSMPCCWPRACASGCGLTASWRRGSCRALGPLLPSAWRQQASTSCASWQRWNRGAWRRWRSATTPLVGACCAVPHAPLQQTELNSTPVRQHRMRRLATAIACCRQRGARGAGQVPAASGQRAVPASGLAAGWAAGAGDHRQATAAAFACGAFLCFACCAVCSLLTCCLLMVLMPQHACPLLCTDCTCCSPALLCSGARGQQRCHQPRPPAGGLPSRRRPAGLPLPGAGPVPLSPGAAHAHAGARQREGGGCAGKTHQMPAVPHMSVVRPRLTAVRRRSSPLLRICASPCLCCC